CDPAEQRSVCLPDHGDAAPRISEWNARGLTPRMRSRSVAAATESATRPSPTPTAAGLACLRLAHVDLPAAHIATIQLGDRLARLARRAHLDEAEAARAAGVAVVHDGRRFDRYSRREVGVEAE